MLQHYPEEVQAQRIDQIIFSYAQAVPIPALGRGDVTAGFQKQPFKERSGPWGGRQTDTGFRVQILRHIRANYSERILEASSEAMRVHSQRR